MKNKAKYNLEFITIKPKYMITGCGKRITDNFTFDIYYRDKVIAKNIKAKDTWFNYLMKWLEGESE